MKCKEGYISRGGRCIKRGLSGAITHSDKVNRVVLILIALFSIVNLIMIIIVPDTAKATAIYFFVAIMCWVGYNTALLQDTIIGIPKGNVIKSLLIGIAIGAGFFVINQVIPYFAIGIPELLTVASNIRWFIIVGLAPLGETILFEGLIFAIFRDPDLAGLSDVKANLIKSILFAMTHSLAYGLIFGVLLRWIDVFNSYYAVIGLFISAFLVSMVFGYIITRKGLDSLIIPWTSHTLINLTLVSLSIVYI